MIFSSTIPLQPCHRQINTQTLTYTLSDTALGMIHAPAWVALTVALFPFLSNTHAHHCRASSSPFIETVNLQCCPWPRLIPEIHLHLSRDRLGWQVGPPPRSTFLFGHKKEIKQRNDWCFLLLIICPTVTIRSLFIYTSTNTHNVHTHRANEVCV